ncbi:hypothetical protein BTUL_0064g00390 [Botrytis tulipae]|uniref:Uncharacterized protein n=1 Tax=Botrytis tulipae TaxID=87230 RepID=A0A4Z1ERX5_9HELO|nr:hypothetical protein BTUL_0064g00390 [Botrytis tulipae]
MQKNYLHSGATLKHQRELAKRRCQLILRGLSDPYIPRRTWMTIIFFGEDEPLELRDPIWRLELVADVFDRTALTFGHGRRYSGGHVEIGGRDKLVTLTGFLGDYEGDKTARCEERINDLVEEADYFAAAVNLVSNICNYLDSDVDQYANMIGSCETSN